MLTTRARFVSFFACTLLAACSDNGTPPVDPPPPVGDGEFESASPGMSGSRGPGGIEVDDSGAPPTAGGVPQGSPTPTDGGGERAIEEADIIKVAGDKLYALSRYGGLSVVDISRRDRLSLLGRHKVVASPFEMYVRDGVVIALYQGYSEYAYDDSEGQWTYYQTSSVVVLDARDPAAISELGRFTIPGDITDSRIVGDILYVAAFENGHCYGCEQNRPRTNILSLNVADPAAITKVDEISREDRANAYSFQRSLTATDERLYLAGPTWSTTEQPVGSTIEVFDISDPNGDIQEGASVRVNGQIQSRWQMDEHEGVLRVISQPFQWNLSAPPTVQTFRVQSSLELTELGSAALRLPRPEQLQSARFDGTRAYAVTFERTDPLFTIDLADPAAPRQVGELEMPGWLYHMEPRGERLLGLGFDQGNEDGAITVSLFDVSDLAKPAMLRRVNFGGDWGNLAEDQNRIHKAFNVLDSAGLILVPFSGYSYDEKATECWGGTYLSGVQLVDYVNDDLALRGVAPGRGEARRGFIVNDRLLTMSDERVESFDITDRDAPKTTASLPLAQRVEHTQAAGNKVVRVGSDWWTQTTELDVTTVPGAGSPSALGRLSLPQLSDKCNGGTWLSEVHSSEDAAYLFYSDYSYDVATGKEQSSTRVLTVDVSDITAPALVADASLNFAPSYPSYLVGAVNSGSPTVNVGSTFAIASRTHEYGSNRYEVRQSELKVLDLLDPAHPVVTTVALPKTFGATGLVTSGNVVATSQFEPLNPEFTRVRFYLERVDITNPRAPERYPSVNIPGSLLAYDAASGNALTVDYESLVFEDVTMRTCSEQYGSYRFRPENDIYSENALGTCEAIRQTIHLVHVDADRARIVSSHELELGEYVGSTAVGDDRVFVSLSRNSYGDVARGPIGLTDVGYWGFPSGKLGLLSVAGIHSGALSVGRVELETGNYWYGSGPLVASGHRAVLATGFQGALTIVDATDPEAPFVASSVEVPGYVQDLDVIAGTVVASMGQDGVATLELE